jgi:hypothetical protein
MTVDLHGPVAIMTSGGGGIGRSIALTSRVRAPTW